MRHLPSIEDEMRRMSTYELSDGRIVRLHNEDIEKYGVEKVLHIMGLREDPAAMPRRPVYWCGEMIGTLPHSFNPARVRSLSRMYDQRPGDFIEHGNGWRASDSLGPSDIASVDGFKPA